MTGSTFDRRAVSILKGMHQLFSVLGGSSSSAWIPLPASKKMPSMHGREDW